MIRPQMFLLLFLIVTNAVVLESQPLGDAFWRNVIEDTYKAGPYNSFCNRTEPTEEMPPDPMGDFYPCQLQCSCDPFTCGSKLPCCPDMSEKNVTFRNTSCLYPVIYTEPVDIFRDPRRHADFPIRMVHGCGDEHIGSELHEKCLSYRSTKDLDYMIPVISEETELVYVNRFCAECSDELNFTQFDSIFACRDNLLEEYQWEYLALERTYKNEIYLIQEGVCVYKFKLPYGRRIENHKCFQVEFNFCNESDYPGVIDPYYETACGAYELPYQFGIDIYRNYHCAVCNMGHDWVQRSLCIRSQQFVLRISFYTLINLDQTHVTGFNLGISEQDRLLCGNGSMDVFDKYLNKCRRPHCPLFHVKKNDSCLPVYSGFDIQMKRAVIHFEEVNATEKMVDPYSNFTNDVLPVLQKEIVEGIFNDLSVAILQFLQKQGANNSYESDFIIDYRWYSTSDEELVPKKVARFFTPVFVNISLLHTSGYFKARLITKFKIINWGTQYFMFQQNNYSLLFQYFDNLWQIPNSLQMNRLLICNRVTLSRAEFNQSGDSMTLLSGDVIQLTQAYIVTDNQIHLCLDDYIVSSSKSVFHEQSVSGMQEIVVILSFVCSIISIACLLVTVVIYALLKPLRTVPGKINACLCVTLLIAQILQQFTMDLVEFPTACVVFGALIHLSWSITLFWMNVSSFNLFRIFSPRNIGHEVKPSLVMYSLYVVGMSCFLVSGNVAHGFFVSDNKNFGYGQPVCYISSVIGLLITFIAPVGAIILSNIVFLAITIWRISRTTMPEGSHSTDRNNVLIYIKMSTLTGCCWLFGFIRILTGAYVFEILFILTNASQGLFLMLSFVCNKRVLSLLKDQCPQVQNKY